MKPIKALIGFLILIVLINIGGMVYLYKEISSLNSLTNLLYSKVYSSNDDNQDDDLLSKIEHLESKSSDLESELRKVKSSADDAERKIKESENKFYALCTIHSVCDL